MAQHSINGTPGKWGRAASCIGDMLTARDSSKVVEVTSPSPAALVLNTMQNNDIVDLYSVGHKEVMRAMCETGIEVPFQHTLQLLGFQGEVVRVSALFDGCTMVSAMCTTVFEASSRSNIGWESGGSQEDN